MMAAASLYVLVNNQSLREDGESVVFLSKFFVG